MLLVAETAQRWMLGQSVENEMGKLLNEAHVV
jgi:hypothetical protein